MRNRKKKRCESIFPQPARERALNLSICDTNHRFLCPVHFWKAEYPYATFENDLVYR